MSSAIELMAQRFRQCREYLGFTQQEIADVLGLHRPAVSEIESGDRKVSAEELKTLAKLYCKPIDYFLGESEPEPSKELGVLLDDLSAEDRDELIHFAQFLAWKKRAEK